MGHRSGRVVRDTVTSVDVAGEGARRVSHPRVGLSEQVVTVVRTGGSSRRPLGWRTAVLALTGSAVEHRPADVVAQPLVVEHELTNRARELVVLPAPSAGLDSDRQRTWPAGPLPIRDAASAGRCEPGGLPAPAL